MRYFTIKGVLPPMITPFTEDGIVDYAAFVANIERWNAFDLAGYLVLGSNSETPYLTEDEKLELVRLTAKHATPGKLIMAGTGLESTQETIRLTNAAAGQGAQCALILTPNYYGSAMGDAAQLEYFTAVADNAEIPILIYNVTKFTHINISPAVVAKLSRHPNIIGMKDSAGDVPQLVRFLNAGLDKEFNLMVGTASSWFPALTLGLRAGIMALANCCPGECIEIQRMYESGDTEGALVVYRRMFPVNDAVTAQFGVAGLKHACNELGFQGGVCRKPMLELGKERIEKLEAILREALVWGLQYEK